MFQKVSPRRGFEDVVHQIQEAIVQGRLKPGDRLPSQRDMKEMFQVSRATILEALRVLEKAGLIAIRPGALGGAFVSQTTSDAFADALLLLLNLEGVSLPELAEFRERLEGGTAYWAALRASDEEIASLKQRLEMLRELAAADTPWTLFLATEMEIHWAIAQYSANRPSLATMKAITRAMREAYEYITPGLYAKVLSDMEAICDAIGRRAPVEAEEKMKVHIAFFNEDMMSNRRRVRPASRATSKGRTPEARATGTPGLGTQPSLGSPYSTPATIELPAVIQANPD